MPVYIRDLSPISYCTHHARSIWVKLGINISKPMRNILSNLSFTRLPIYSQQIHYSLSFSNPCMQTRVISEFPVFLKSSGTVFNSSSWYIFTYYFYYFYFLTIFLHLISICFAWYSFSSFLYIFVNVSFFQFYYIF